MSTFDKVKKGEQDEHDKLKQAMMDRCIPVAKKILQIIVEDGLELGDVVIPRDENGKVLPMSEQSRPAKYQEAAKKIQQAMLDANLLWMERHMVFMLVKQPMDMLQNIVLTDLETTYQRGICQMFGIEVFGELTFKQIDEFLKSKNKDEAPA